ncbi:phospholipase C, phosphocholine-specific [Olivibacter sp. SDN3]|uniref:phosphocholine-specific phospholipase C n=1 Tax=Olivibacter sp. SDN3 TaxID=2764720 RepID=UPI0016512EFC|nr:phospholipase C, phosphocholine-specific [Olivibacter sp. SDN3]QNL50634.1 phospholipase C, phosphocholine-specific [Olivibacter sp. SDN3]
MDNRREFIKKAAMLAGGAGLWGTLPESIQQAIAINPAPGSTFYDAEHIVLLMQENRSFDHCFGTLQGVRGFNDPRAITLPNKNSVWLQSDRQGHTYAPFRMDIKNSKITWMESLPHSWGNQVDARNNGKYDGWLEAKRSGIKAYQEMPLTLGYYNREDIPFYYALADAFTICDQHFCSSLTGTTTNRLFFWSGTLKARSGDIANVRNSDVYFNREVNWKTFPERLEEQGISWRVYQNELSVQTVLTGEDESWLGNFTDNNLEWFSQYHVRFSKGHHRFLVKRLEELPQEIAALKKTISSLKPSQTQKHKGRLEQKIAQLAKFKAELAKYNPDNFEKLSTFEQNLHRRAFTTNIADPHYHETEELSYRDEEGVERQMRVPKGDVLYQFRKDVNEGELPTVSWLVAPQNFSDHPSAPWYGAWYVSEVLDILTKNPEVWKKTIFILNYDENDGCFDHIPPFVAPKPNDPNAGAVSDGLDTSDEYVTMEEEQRRERKESDTREGPVGLGYRVPLIIASPWTRGGWVNSEVCDVTSTIRFMESFLQRKGKKVKENNISSWRRTVSGDLTSAFRPYKGEKMIFPEALDRNQFVQGIYNAQFKSLPTYKALTVEEIGIANNDPIHAAVLPQQEVGIRNSCALAYELAVEGMLSATNDRLELRFSAKKGAFGEQALGSAFNVYAPGKYLQKGSGGAMSFDAVSVWSFAVSAGDELTYAWPLECFEHRLYHLRVYGPNGFFRELRGNTEDSLIETSAVYQRTKNSMKSQLSGNIDLRIKNKQPQMIRVRVKDHAYGNGVVTKEVGALGELTLPVNTEKSFQWYDFSVTIDGIDTFERRYAGRVETGKHSKSDPFMGRVI